MKLLLSMLPLGSFCCVKAIVDEDVTEFHGGLGKVSEAAAAAGWERILSKSGSVSVYSILWVYFGLRWMLRAGGEFLPRQRYDSHRGNRGNSILQQHFFLCQDKLN